MPYKLRFVQKFKASNEKEFLEIEQQFEQFEIDFPEFPKGKRYMPLSGMLPGNTLIWESEFDSLEALISAYTFLQSDDRHENLFKIQSEYLLDAHTEIYKPYDS